MKKNFKKMMGLGLILSLTAASLAGCGPAAGDKFIIGGIGPISGDAASYGTSVKQGAEIAVEEINKAGGVTVGGKKLTLELNFMDDEAQPDKAVTAFNALMDAKINALMGTVTSDAGLGIIDLTKEEGILMLTPSGSAAGLTKYDNAFRLCFTDPLQGVTMANYAKDNGYTKIAVIYNNSDNYSTGMMQAFVDQVAANGATVVANESFVEGDVDFNTQLTKIKGTDAEVIFIPSYYKEAALITTQAAGLGMSLPFLGGDGWDGVIAQTVDPAVLEGAVFLTPFNAGATDAKTADFVKKYDEEYKAIPDQFAADGYDSIYVIAAALEKAGSTDNDKLIAAMTQITVDGLTGSMTFNANGEPNKGANFVEIRGGKYISK
ncbi:branched-chain amino acid transport system substrate-binding protein [Anaerotaenia torta]|uniref:ABC transporter substrate-binding protein n=1 Tax=Anaerotaenia torta TaxID=433293 RepID=UPI003D238AFB